jgi:hypothetical protein
MYREKVKCNKCKKIFECYISEKRKYCSRTCQVKTFIGKPSWNKGLKTGLKPWLGKKRPNISGEKCYAWKGDDVGYRALHNWVEKRLGKPMCCDFCNVINLKRYHWANKSKKYKREITDWIRLCPRCHAKYDRKN